MENGWSPIVVAHAVTASYAIAFGAVNLFRKTKGDKPHRIIGFVWLASMYFVIISSFWIQMIRLGQFSWIHGLSAFTFCTISLGLYAAIRHNISAHMGYMRGSYFGLLGAFIGVVVVPSRLIPQLAMQETLKLTLFIVCVVLSATFFAVATVHFMAGNRNKAADT